MAKIVLGIGTSHTPMLNAPVGDWARFIERDRVRPHLTKDGRPVSYDELERLAPADVQAQLAPGQEVKILDEVVEYYKIAPPADAAVYVK